ncbi:BQ5605_C001g00367 [Microbotryum silenes-dioicae]|uniref:BQ5605_C001g00367 protein n=1 Tax=Microbotryum silenes-dioicae TaxID=796604 RepID=A0A2X0M7B7_9BASI|nr:BQ5605_C001g00367 [Microbotryum silenes-dioicae]
MGKVKKRTKDKSVKDTKAEAKKAKKDKQSKKEEAKLKKSKGKNKDDGDMDEDDLIRTLEEYRERWAAEHTVSEDVVDGPPSRRANATLTACPVKDHLYLIGGEYFDGSTVAIYPDVFRYSPDKNEWRRFTSPTAPGPRSAHQVCASPAGGGKLWLFGGEFSAPNQSSFHHYRDLWCFDISTHTWERYDTKLRPSARSGHRMAMWKHLMFLFGGFQDTGIRTSYLGDLWVWDTLNCRWHQIEIGQVDRKPGPRSGFSFIPCPEGVILHGGYTKTYEGKRATGQALNDTWLLRMPPPNEHGEYDWKALKWEKRKKVGYAPTPRSGCTMALWSPKNMGVLFGGVSDEDKDEETLDSTFYSALFGYNMGGNGRWISLPLKRKKKAGGKKKKAKLLQQQQTPKVSIPSSPAANDDGEGHDEGDDERMEEDDQSDNEDDTLKPWEVAEQKKQEALNDMDDEDDTDDPEKTIPGARYNAMLAVQRNTLYLYGGILEAGDKEYTLDDFFTLQLDKLDRFNCLRECILEGLDWKGSDSENDSSDDDEDDDGAGSDKSDNETEDEEDDGIAPAGEDANMEAVPLEDLQLSEVNLARIAAQKEQAEREELRKRALAFRGVSTSADRTAEDLISTPQPGETLAKFFARSKEYWTRKAHESVGAGNRGKELRRDGFSLCEEAFRKPSFPESHTTRLYRTDPFDGFFVLAEQYQPLLEELQRIQEQAGLDAAEAAKGARAGLGMDSRNRR